MRAATLIGGMTATVLLAAAAVAQPTYEAIPLPAGTLFNSFSTGVRAVSADGRTVAGNAASGNGDRGWRWRSGIGRVDYGPPAYPFVDMEVTGLSSDGSTVTGAVPFNGRTTAFRSRDDGAFELYTLPAGDDELFRPRPSGDGSVVVANSVRFGAGGNPTTSRILRYTTLSTFDVIPAPASAAQGEHFFAGMSSDTRRIVGIAQDSARGNLQHATVWREGQGTTWLPVTPNAARSFALTASREGDFTAGAMIDASGQYQLARWQGDELLTFDLPTGRRSIEPFSISNDGSIITGTLFGNGADLGDIGFVWTPQTGIVLARDYLLSVGVPFPIGPNQQIRGVTRPFVSADGLSISGRLNTFNTQTNQFESSLFRATIPSPATISMIAGLAIVSIGRRRHSV
jgi:hypothetical protein